MAGKGGAHERSEPGAGFLGRIRSAHPRLSPAGRKIADYLSREYQRAAFMSTREIAAEVGVSMASVVRLADQLGYASFDELATSIQDRIAFDLTAVDRLRTSSVEQHTGAGLLQRAIAAENAELQRLVAAFDESEFDQAVAWIADARQVVVLGLRWVAPLAEYLRYSLNKVRPDVSGYQHSDSQLDDRIADMDGRDLLVAIGFARYPRDLISALEHARARRVPVLAITDSPASPVQPLSDLALLARSEVLSVAGTLGAPGVLLNCLISAVGRRLGDAAVRRLGGFEETARTRDLYVSANEPPTNLPASAPDDGEG